jgi:hypothetical protein
LTKETDSAVPRASREFGVEDVEVVAPALQALAGQRGELDLGDAEPRPVLGGVVDLPSLGQRERLLGFEGLVQRGDAVGVEVVHGQHQELVGAWNGVLDWP